jgi:hypothetical protein
MQVRWLPINLDDVNVGDSLRVDLKDGTHEKGQALGIKRDRDVYWLELRPEGDDYRGMIETAVIKQVYRLDADYVG